MGEWHDVCKGVLLRIPPGIKAKPPGERLPVPAGWRF
jgi:hypothetical protein